VSYNKIILSDTAAKPQNLYFLKKNLCCHFFQAKISPESLFVQKSNDHRGISITKVEDLNLQAEGTFVQEYVSRPLLVDGHKFDIGVYTIQTSIDPLRVYIYNGDMILR
jgi:Tubulin-tyrosine ligase family.